MIPEGPWFLIIAICWCCRIRAVCWRGCSRSWCSSWWPTSYSPSSTPWPRATTSACVKPRDSSLDSHPALTPSLLHFLPHCAGLMDIHVQLNDTSCFSCIFIYKSYLPLFIRGLSILPPVFLTIWICQSFTSISLWGVLLSIMQLICCEKSVLFIETLTLILCSLYKQNIFSKVWKILSWILPCDQFLWSLFLRNKLQTMFLIKYREFNIPDKHLKMV